MDKRTQLSLLFDCYGPLLTHRQRSMLEQHLGEDCSLGEIAEREGISRQAVRDALMRGEEQLLLYEEKLGLLKRDMELITALRELIDRAETENIRGGLLSLVERIEGNDGV